MADFANQLRNASYPGGDFRTSPLVVDLNTAIEIVEDAIQAAANIAASYGDSYHVGINIAQKIHEGLQK